MPIYEYACQECGFNTDALQKISDDPLVDCPACNKPALKRLISAPRFRLKGDGWYETDFKTKNQRNLAKGDSDSGSKSGSKSSNSKTTDTKSSAKKSESAKSAKAAT